MVRETQHNVEETWQIDRSHLAAWRSWNGEVVVYDDFSGDTLKMDIVMAEAFRHILKAPASETQLVDHIASTFELETDLRLRRLIALALERFYRAGLIEPATISAVAARKS